VSKPRPQSPPPPRPLGRNSEDTVSRQTLHESHPTSPLPFESSREITSVPHSFSHGVVRRSSHHKTQELHASYNGESLSARDSETEVLIQTNPPFISEIFATKHLNKTRKASFRGSMPLDLHAKGSAPVRNIQIDSSV